MPTKKLLLIIVAILIIPVTAFTQPHVSSNYTLTGARIVVSGGKAGSYYYSMDRVAIGNFLGGKAGSMNYVLQAGLIMRDENISLILNPVTWGLGLVEAGGMRIAEMIVENAGNVKTDYGIRVYDSSGTWQAVTEPGNNGKNTFVMSAVFTDRDSQSVAFNENGNEDVVSGESAKSSDIKFACSESGKNGINVMPAEHRKLWLKFEAPEADTTGGAKHEEHYIYIEVTAKIAK
ncbi:MAG: hypothetical protein NG740_02705 [Omnitrophica bacterium]|nr:hypothetical protein [Candidatus Omnitrophota bacterium]